MTSWKNTDLTPNQLVALQGPAPCDDCPNFGQCRAAEVACADFGTYARTGSVNYRNREPDEDTFIRIYKDYPRKRKP